VTEMLAGFVGRLDASGRHSRINRAAAAYRWRRWWQDPMESAKLAVMEKTFQAVFQGGVLRPEEFV
jgi:hypothetical protein